MKIETTLAIEARRLLERTREALRDGKHDNEELRSAVVRAENELVNATAEAYLLVMRPNLVEPLALPMSREGLYRFEGIAFTLIEADNGSLCPVVCASNCMGYSHLMNDGQRETFFVHPRMPPFGGAMQIGAYYVMPVMTSSDELLREFEHMYAFVVEPTAAAARVCLKQITEKATRLEGELRLLAIERCKAERKLAHLTASAWLLKSDGSRTKIVPVSREIEHEEDNETDFAYSYADDVPCIHSKRTNATYPMKPGDVRRIDEVVFQCLDHAPSEEEIQGFATEQERK